MAPVDGTPSANQGADPFRLGGVCRQGSGIPAQGDPGQAPAGGGSTPGKVPGDTFKLSPESENLIARLKARDAQVRAHEAAHLAAGGGVTRGGATFSYQHGPDGQSYAVGGEVGVDTSAVANNPQATIAKANIIRAAALAPADPSPQDQSVAAQASVMAANAASELAKAAFKDPDAPEPGSLGNPKVEAKGSNPPGEAPPEPPTGHPSHPRPRRFQPIGSLLDLSF